jgi:hypothetical protein
MILMSKTFVHSVIGPLVEAKRGNLAFVCECACYHSLTFAQAHELQDLIHQARILAAGQLAALNKLDDEFLAAVSAAIVDGKAKSADSEEPTPDTLRDPTVID